MLCTGMHSAYLQDDEDGNARPKFPHVPVHARHHVGHCLTDGDEHAQKLLGAVSAGKPHVSRAASMQTQLKGLSDSVLSVCGQGAVMASLARQSLGCGV